MNKQQRAYAKAKAAFALAKEHENETECAYLAAHGYKGPLYALEGKIDADLYDALEIGICENEDCAAAFSASIDARKALVKAEDALIEYGISISPAGIRDTLRSGVKRREIREKLIGLAFRLDTRTVRA